jgi:two-component system NtrC family sensor kinase
VTRAAAAGATRQELIKEAVQVLLAGEQADRVGVWLESNEATHADQRGLPEFRGLVANRDGEAAPLEWARLFPEAPLPRELRSGGKSVEQELDDAAGRAMIGALVGMRRALWTPVEIRGRLCGVLLAAVRKKSAPLPRAALESVAAELAVALELEEERLRASERQADLVMARRILEALRGPATPEQILADLAASCTESGVAGPAAVFAVIGRMAIPPAGLTPVENQREGDLQTAGSGRMEFLWRAGTEAWTHAVEADPLAAIWRRALEAHRVIGSEITSARSHGEVARMVAFPLEAGGETLGVMVVGVRQHNASLTMLERLELRAALAASALLAQKRGREAAEQLSWRQTLLENSREATILINAEGKIAGLSAGTRELLGEGQPEDTQGAPALAGRLQEVFHPREWSHLEMWSREKREAAQQPLEAELRTGARARVRNLSRGNSGVNAVRLEPLLPRAAETLSGRAEVELLNVIEWLEEGVILFDAQDDIRAMNTRFAQIASLQPEELARITTLNALIARLAGQATEPESFAEHWRELARATDSGFREELRFVRPVPRVLERAVRPVLSASGMRLGRVEIYRDLTAQRVFHSKLLQTEKLAVFGQMVTGIVHEISNPLTSILGYAQRLLLRDTRDAHSLEARQIFQEAERASTILRQLLLTARDSRPERRRVSLNQVVSRTVELQRFSFAAEKVHLELDLDPVLPFVLGDAGQLQQVLMNLIGNARQALEERRQGGTIRLLTRRVGEHRVLLEVSDTGPGIPQAIQSRIFDPFFTTKPAGVGTGLGLAIVLGIVREHGGSVNVRSPAGGGAVFSMEFPAFVVAGERSPEPEVRMPDKPPFEVLAGSESHPVSQPGGALTAWADARVLVVEDEPTVARLIADVLEDEGLRVDVLFDGREALERATGGDYQLIICDMKMPALDGQRFYETVRSAEGPPPPFLFVTGDVLSQHTREFLERNSVPYLAKPFRVEELTEGVREVLADAGTKESSSARAARTNAARH